MKAESYFLLFFGGFCGILAIVFWAIGLSNVYREMTSGGTVMLAATFLLGILPGGYYFWWSRRITPRPEDDPQATQETGAGVIGAFPSSSIWPFVLGFGAFFVALSLVFGFWSAIFGFTLALSALIGVIIESRRGGHI